MDKKNSKKYRKIPGKLTAMMTAFSENESILRKYLRRFSSNYHDIEDITQETILRALKAEKKQKIDEPKAFLFGIARNVVRKELDKKSKSLVDYIEDFDDERYVSNEPSLEDSLDSHQRMLIFGEALSTLPVQCRKVFMLKKVYGYSHLEISNKLGISISTTEKHVASGLKRCGEFMDRRMNQEEGKKTPFSNLFKSTT
ncbi:RNA polymerase sigma factor [Paremcibacter congregatus]|uniref:RNA polymerase sigma factor n=1 Tax=Paremcibacter congregatus TaxID=2043170 RepID=A0A2G4YVL0_9PROT|nr:RNA polymerase sigma factor [Paremcibacter congregatus]PHZ86361.1 RNA polymerase subunit sigma-70 [Paremcibacter congregatus]QDE27993.1 RNA polymerase sigma factor [Paremcibacter congregatus]